jgi:SAM-dependent methyltransferase/5'-deoxynucleotidase YfbR-like HD superfamily hydrolase
MGSWNDDEVLADLLGALAARGLMSDPDRIEGAFRVAAHAHAGQRRSDGAPYLKHPVAVARILVEEWRVEDPDLVVAALLHDAVEDSPLTLEEVEASFGARVRELVDALTKPKLADGGDKAAHLRAYFERLRQAPAGASIVKAADRVSNLRDVLSARWPEEKKRTYVAEALEAILPVVRERASAQVAQALEETARETLARLDRGEGDVPDVGPTDEARAITDDDPLLRRSEHVSFFRRAADVFLYHDLVGDIMQLHEKVIAFIDHFAEPRRESAARQTFASDFLPGDFDAFFEVLRQHLVLLGEGEDDAAIVRDWYPIQGPWIVSYRPKQGPPLLCFKDRQGGEPVVERLSPLFGRLWSLCTGDLSVTEVIARLQKEFPAEQELDQKVRDTVRAWTHSRRQLLKLLPRPRSAFEMVGLPPYVHSTMPYQRLRGSEGPTPEPSLRDYHKLEITSADDQFERRETTLSHAFRVPHAALSNRTYGGQLARVLVDRDALHDDGTRAPMLLVEVGGGTGFFARGFLDGLALRAPRVYNRSRYVICDLAPALRASQRERTSPHKERVRIVGGDAEALPLRDRSVDLLIANEMIADLPVLPVRRDELERGEGGVGADLVRRYGIPVDDAPGLFHVNSGAIRLLEEVARVLKPGGAAFLSEFGSYTNYPDQSTHLDHPEFSIHFGHLRAVATRLGLEVGLEELPALLELDGRVKVLQTTQSFFDTLRAFLGSLGVRLEKVAYTEEMFADLCAGKVEVDRLEGVKFTPCGQRVLGLKPPEFKALVLRRPQVEGRAVQAVTIDF